jgi:hypothetical protein
MRHLLGSQLRRPLVLSQRFFLIPFGLGNDTQLGTYVCGANWQRRWPLASV